MKVVFRPLFVVIFILMTLSFSVSMARRSAQHRANTQALAVVAAENERLQLQKAALERQIESAADPFSQEKIYRESHLAQRVGEQTLKLSTFDYQPSGELPTGAQARTPAQEWLALLGLHL